MNISEIEQYKRQFDRVKDSLQELKEEATRISDYIDSKSLIPQEVISELLGTINSYSEQESALKTLGDSLSISVGANLHDIEEAIHLYEEAHSFAQLREVVLDYFRLTSEVSDIKKILEDSKRALIEKCNEDHLTQETIAPYKIVVDSVKSGSKRLNRDEYKLIARSIDDDIAYATDHGELIFNANTDILEYTSAITSDAFAPQQHQEKKNEHSGADILPVSELAPTPTNVTEAVTNTEPTPLWPAYQTYLPDGFSAVISDHSVPATLKELKQLVKQDDIVPYVLWAHAREKLCAGDDKYDDTIALLQKEEYLVRSEISFNSITTTFLTLSKKGWSCFTKQDIREFLSHRHVPLNIPVPLCPTPDMWTSLFAARIYAIHNFFTANKQKYLLWPERSVPVATPLNEQNYVVCSALFEVGNEIAELESMKEMTNSLDGRSLIIIVNTKGDIAILKDSFETENLKDRKVLFSVAEDDFMVLDCDGLQHSMLTQAPKETTPDNLSDTSKAVEIPKSDDAPEDETNTESPVLQALNQGKYGTPNASRFKREIQEIARTSKDVKTILPLFSNLGAMTLMQIQLFGAIMGHFDSDSASFEKITDAVNLLTEKGFLVEYQYAKGDNVQNIFCLSSYCSGCMNKESISSLRQFWSISLGKNWISGNGTMPLYDLLLAVTSNTGLLEYLVRAKSCLDKSKFFKVVSSIRWKEDHYQVGLYWDSGIVFCSLVIFDNQLDEFDGDNLIVSHLLREKLASKIQKSNMVFIVGDESLELWDNSARNTTTTNDTVSPVVPPKSEAEDYHEQTEATTGTKPKEADPVTPATLPLDSMSSTGSATDIHTQEGYSTITLLSTDAPSDDSLSSQIVSILNKPASSERDLSNNIADAVMLAYSLGLIDGYDKCDLLSAELQLATNLIFDDIAYSSLDLSLAYSDAPSEFYPIQLAAYCFANLVPAEAFDYALQAQTATILNGLSGEYSLFGPFKSLLSKILEVQKSSPSGFTSAISSKLGDNAEQEKYMSDLAAQAKAYMNYTVPRTRMKALPVLYGACFGNASDLQQCMAIIAENKMNDADFVKLILGEYANAIDGGYKVDDSKIEDKLTLAWDNATQKNHFKLEYDARAQALKQFKVRLELMVSWVNHVSAQEEDHIDIPKLKSLRKEMLKIINTIDADASWQFAPCANVLRFALHRMKQLLLGQINNIDVFAGILLTGVLSMGENGFPIIEKTLTSVKYCEPWRLVSKHINTEKKPVEVVRDEILGSAGIDNRLLDNLNQLKMLGKWIHSNDESYTIDESQLADALSLSEEETKRFFEDLELAYTYGQINENEKESIAGIVVQYKPEFLERNDFACWRELLSALRLQIDEYASSRSVVLHTELNNRIQKEPESSLLAEAKRLLIEEKNYAVAEEYINRFDVGETELSPEMDAVLHDVDYFSDFIRPNTFDPLYRVCANGAGRALRSFAWNYLDKRLPGEWSSRQRKDSEELVGAWPARKNSSLSTDIKKLFSGLGFDVQDTKKHEGRKEEIYKLTVRPTERSKADYLHPISAFGTQTKSPLNAILLYGNYTEKQLVDTVTSLDLGGISVVLIDRALTVASRRQIGEIFHTQTSGQNPFLLVDQVLFLYLAMHQITERLPALLKCTLPFTTYQPFVRDGGPTADEMFFGRSKELSTIIDPNGACVVYGGRQLGKTALLQRAESRCMKPENKAYAVYVSILDLDTEEKVAYTLAAAIEKKTKGAITPPSTSIRGICDYLEKLYIDNKISQMLLLIDEVDCFLGAIADIRYTPIQPLIDLKRQTRNSFKFVVAGLHNVCRAKNATSENGVFGQLGTPLCIKPLSPTDALQLLSKPLKYLGFQIDRYPHLETILTNTNYYPGILQFFGYNLVETLSNQYSKYYRAADGNPPFTLRDDQLGAIMSSSDLNKSIKDKFRLSLEMDKRYFMLARCIAILYHYSEESRRYGSWLGFSVDDIMEISDMYEIHCLEAESKISYITLLDEMTEMGILSKVEGKDIYRLRRNSFVDIIGDSFEVLEDEIKNSNKEE